MRYEVKQTRGETKEVVLSKVFDRIESALAFFNELQDKRDTNITTTLTNLTYNDVVCGYENGIPI